MARESAVVPTYEAGVDCASLLYTITTMQSVNAYLESLYFVSRDDPAERLATVANTLKKLGNPQDTIPAIHIAGTSGKGSTAYYASALLQAAGYRVGLIVSPHVNTVRERSQINGSPLSEQEYVAYFNKFTRLPSITSTSLSYIEFLVVFSYWLFASIKVDYMVIEVGLGGRLDPTNSIVKDKTVRVITDIGLDHTEILGDTLPKIAAEKAGIIHKNDTVVMNEQGHDVMDVIEKISQNHNARLTVFQPNESAPAQLPSFQRRNFSLALAAADKRLSLDNKSPLTGENILTASAITIPGRFEQFHVDGVDIILDAAHNPQKLTALASSVRKAYPDKNAVYLVAFGKNKQHDLGEMLSIIQPTASRLYVTNFTSTFKPSVEVNEIAALATSRGLKSVAIEDPYDAFEVAKHHAKEHSKLLIATGSFYLIDGLRNLLRSSEELTE